MASLHRIWAPTMNAGNAFSSRLYASNELARLRPQPQLRSGVCDLALRFRNAGMPQGSAQEPFTCSGLRRDILTLPLDLRGHRA